MRKPTEEWRAVAGYEGSYEVSSLGRVRSLTRVVRSNKTGRRLEHGRIMSFGTTRKGYKCVPLASGDGSRTTYAVHRLVAQAFLGSRGRGQQVHHLDSDKGNNAAANLAYVTGSQNIRAAHSVGRNKSGISDDDVRRIRELAKTRTQASIARQYGVNQSLISRFVNGVYRSHVK